jgi:hypothetical protein
MQHHDENRDQQPHRLTIEAPTGSTAQYHLDRLGYLGALFALERLAELGRAELLELAPAPRPAPSFAFVPEGHRVTFAVEPGDSEPLDLEAEAAAIAHELAQELDHARHLVDPDTAHTFGTPAEAQAVSLERMGELLARSQRLAQARADQLSARQAAPVPEPPSPSYAPRELPTGTDERMAYLARRAAGMLLRAADLADPLVASFLSEAELEADREAVNRELGELLEQGYGRLAELAQEAARQAAEELHEELVADELLDPRGGAR